MDITIAQGAALQHAELVEQEAWVITSAVEMPVSGHAFLIAMGGTDGAVHFQHDILETVAVVETVDPLPVQIGQRRPVLRHGQRSVSNRPICEAEAACA